MNEFAFQIPSAILGGAVLVVAIMVWFTTMLLRRGVAPRRLTTLLVLRIVFLVALLFLAARPVWTSPDQQEQTRDEIALLIDRSNSMSVREGDQTRYQQAIEFAQ